MKITTESGFKCELDTEALNDWEIHEILLSDDMMRESKFARAVMEKCMSKEDVQRLKDHVRTETGRVPADAIVRALTEILQLVGSEKNS